jgi:hypothetical protein
MMKIRIAFKLVVLDRHCGYVSSRMPQPMFQAIPAYRLATNRGAAGH